MHNMATGMHLSIVKSFDAISFESCTGINLFKSPFCTADKFKAVYKTVVERHLKKFHRNHKVEIGDKLLFTLKFETLRGTDPGGTLNVEVIGMPASETFLENPKNTRIAILRAF